MGKRTTQTERAAVDKVAGMMKHEHERRGLQITAEEARRRAVRIMERSDAERREGKRK